MCDIFTKADAKKLLQNKHVLFLGDSNIRAMYKDVVWLLKHNTLIAKEALKRKLEPSFAGDKLKKGKFLHKGRDYTEVREFKGEGVHTEFHFITRCYTKDIENMVYDWKHSPKSAPDVIVINSCLWDINRWGPNGVPEYKDNLVKLMKLFKTCLPERTLLIWITVPPLSDRIRGGLLIKQVEFMQHTMRFEIMEANLFARQVVVSHGFDVLDVHYYLRMQILGRAPDGIHWLPIPMRHMTNLLMTHITLSWNKPLPGNFDGPSLARFKKLAQEPKKEVVSLPSVPKAAKEEKKSTAVKINTPFRKSATTAKVAASPFRKVINEKLGKTPLTLPSVLENKENDLMDDSFASLNSSNISLCSETEDFSEVSSLYTSFETFVTKPKLFQIEVNNDKSSKPLQDSSDNRIVSVKPLQVNNDNNRFVSKPWQANNNRMTSKAFEEPRQSVWVEPRHASLVVTKWVDPRYRKPHFDQEWTYGKKVGNYDRFTNNWQGPIRRDQNRRFNRQNRRRTPYDFH